MKYLAPIEIKLLRGIHNVRLYLFYSPDVASSVGAVKNISVKEKCPDLKQIDIQLYSFKNNIFFCCFHRCPHKINYVPLVCSQTLRPETTIGRTNIASKCVVHNSAP